MAFKIVKVVHGCEVTREVVEEDSVLADAIATANEWNEAVAGTNLTYEVESEDGTRYAGLTLLTWEEAHDAASE